jgi:opine dehydrogenase
MRPTVSILGAGPAGLALAIDLQVRDINVLVYSHSEHLHHVNAIEKTGYLTATGFLQGTETLRFTTDIGLAICFSNVLILTVPSSGQETILAELEPFSLRSHTVVAMPGNLFSLIATKNFGCILETNLSPYSCRMVDDTLIVFGKKEEISIAASRQSLPTSLYNTIGDIIPVRLKWCSSIIEVSLLNVNGIFHPPLMLMNAGWIESTGGDFGLYSDGLSPAVENTMKALDRVRIQIGEAFGLRLDTALESSNECYGHDFSTYVQLGRCSGPHRDLKAPRSLQHRNITEDVPDLLVSWSTLAAKLGVDATPMRAVVVLTHMATGVDYFEIGRNAHKLRLESMSRKDLIAKYSANNHKE